MNLRDWLLAFLVVFIWGTNFIAMKFGLLSLPPMLMGAARFLFVVFPLIFFVPRPKIPLHLFIIYGFSIGFGQFAFVFTALSVGMPAGLASLVLQGQALFTVLLGVLIMKESLRWFNLVALVISGLGLAILALTREHGEMSLLGFGLTLVGALCWACGNLTIKKIGPVDPLSLVVWAGLIPPIPYLIASYVVDGPATMIQSIVNISMTSLLSILYLSFASSILGYAIWGKLMSKYPVTQVAPLSLMVPFIGVSSAWLILDEPFGIYQMAGGVVVMAGLLLNIFGARIRITPHLRRSK